MALLEQKKNNGICVHKNIILPLMTNTSICNKLWDFIYSLKTKILAHRVQLLTHR